MIVAIRQSGASFSSVYNVRSKTYEAYLLTRDTLIQRLLHLQEQLGAELFAAVPQQPSKSARASVLKAKRNVFNLRTADLPDALSLSTGTRTLLNEYNSVVEELAASLCSSRADILSELRLGLQALLGEPRFRSAVDYACPWLAASYERHTPVQGSDFSNEERGLFSYAVKFFSKSNPYHLFAQLSFLQATEELTGTLCEVLADSAFVLKLEQEALAALDNRGRSFVYLRPSLKEEGVRRFLTVKHGKWHIASVKSGHLLDLLESFLSSPRFCLSGLPPSDIKPRTLSECEDLLVSATGESRRGEIRHYLTSLIQHGILVEFLVSDFAKFPEQLRNIKPELDQTPDLFSDVHLRPLSEPEFIRVQTHLQSSIQEVPAFYLNSYSRLPEMPGPAMIEKLEHELRQLRPFFGSLPNTAPRQKSLSAALRSQLCQIAGRRAPYLALLYDALRNGGNTFDKENGAAACQEWLKTLGELDGELIISDLDRLRPTADRSYAPASLCFNGPIDTSTQRFFPTNIFAGEGRFTSRYLLHRGLRAPAQSKVDRDSVDVQLVPPLTDCRVFGRALYPAGCGFDSRYRYQFDHWIDPSEVLIELFDDGTLGYRHAPTHKLLHIHYVGFLLSDFLPPEYSLFLLNHVDTYGNPFCAKAKTIRRSTTVGELEFVPELRYGSVCLRRTEFRIPSLTVADMLAEEDLLAAAASFRDSLRSAAERTDRHWYVRTGRAGKGGVKPRYLDLHNPLSIHLLRREITPLDKNATITFSPIEPVPEHLPNGHTTEYMIEI